MISKNKLLKGRWGAPLILASGSILSQGVNLSFLPILSRIYSPYDFGNIAVLLAISAIFSLLVTCRYEYAIILSKNEEAASTAVVLSILISLILVSFFTGLWFLFSEVINQTIKSNYTNGWFISVVGITLATVSFNISINYLSRGERYTTIASLKFIQTLLICVFSLVFGGYYIVSNGLIVSQIISIIVVSIISLYLIRDFTQKCQFKLINKIAKDNLNCPKYLLPSAFLDLVTIQMPIIVIAWKFGESIAGQYSMAWRVLMLPASLIGGAVGQVFFQRAAKIVESNTKDLFDSYVRISLFLFCLGFFPAILLFFYGDILFKFVFGDAWIDSGRMAQLLIFSTFLYFVFSPTSSMFVVLKKHSILLWFSIFQLFYRVFAIFLFDEIWNYLFFLVLFELINVVFFEFLLIKLFFRNRRDFYMQFKKSLIFLKSSYNLVKFRLRNIGKSRKAIFSDYWIKNRWLNSETRSGDGSTMKYTENLRIELPILIEKLEVNSMLDAPCGDFNWMKNIEFKENFKYIGGDIVDGLINELNSKYKNNNREFFQLDVISQKLPEVDLWICRDLIFHLPTSAVFQLINNFINSEINYLLITCHTSDDIVNKDVFMGGFRLVNLMETPYNFPEPLFKIKDFIDGFPERYMFVYRRTDLINWKNGAAQ